MKRYETVETIKNLYELQTNGERYRIKMFGEILYRPATEKKIRNYWNLLNKVNA